MLKTFASITILAFMCSCGHYQTMYRKGDQITYKYSGSFTERPVFLKEEVLEKNTDKLVIEVTLSTGNSSRRWIQYLTDNEYNQKNNIVDKLVEISPTNERIPLKNDQNADLYRLYQGTYIIPDDELREVSKEQITVEVCGKNYPATRTTGKQKVGGQVYNYEEVQSTSFKWTHISARYANSKGELYNSRVIECRLQ